MRCSTIASSMILATTNCFKCLSLLLAKSQAEHSLRQRAGEVVCAPGASQSSSMSNRDSSRAPRHFLLPFNHHLLLTTQDLKWQKKAWAADLRNRMLSQFASAYLNFTLKARVRGTSQSYLNVGSCSNYTLLDIHELYSLSILNESIMVILSKKLKPKPLFFFLISFLYGLKFAWKEAII